MTDLVFADESPLAFVDDGADKGASEKGPDSKLLSPWVVMIVDDDSAVHEVTQLVMSNFEFAGRRLEFVSAFSGKEACELLRDRDDVALILLDVVMETEHAGLDAVRYIREVLKNTHARIVLRTGQPGQAPEEHVIKTYDINDYKEKTELTQRKLVTVFYAALRSYRDIMLIDQSRAALRRSIDAITRIYDSKNLRLFASAVLEQAAFLLGHEGQGFSASRITAYATSHIEGRMKVLAATADFAGLLDADDLTGLPPDVQAALQRSLGSQRSFFDGHIYVGYYRSNIEHDGDRPHGGQGGESLLYMRFAEPIDEKARELLEIFCANVAITYGSLLLREEINETQRATVYILCEAVERRSKETGAHVRRVGELSALLAEAVQMSPSDIEFIRQAAPLHDIGKVGISDHILNKPGKLDEAEWRVMQGHALIGAELLRTSDKRILQLGAVIAHEHHERWDGKGYPQGLAGEQIHIAGRIVALVDVLDALVSQRCYKSAWDMDAALAYLGEQSGSQFDPGLVPLLIARLDAVRDIYARYPD